MLPMRVREWSSQQKFSKSYDYTADMVCKAKQPCGSYGKSSLGSNTVVLVSKLLRVAMEEVGVCGEAPLLVQGGYSNLRVPYQPVLLTVIFQCSRAINGGFLRTQTYSIVGRSGSIQDESRVYRTFCFR